MFWKKDNVTGKKLEQINEILKKSFANVKKDTTNIFRWLNYFYKKKLEQEQLIRQLQLQISYSPNSNDDIRRIIDEYYPFGKILASIRELNERVDDLSKRPIRTESTAKHVMEDLSRVEQSDLQSIERRLERLEQRKMSIREKIIKRLTRNSKEYIKSLLVSYIKKYEKISALQLKEIVVDDQNFCSKSSFYRILEEVEELDEIGVLKKGKEKHYICKVMKHS